ncbi:glycerophosphodiester phosphodiesterase [Halomonas shantousis]
MIASRSLLADILSQLRAHARSLLIFHLFFTLLATAIWVPFSAWTLAKLLRHIGRPILSNGQILEVALSPAGLAWLIVAVSFSFLIIFLQQAGMMLTLANSAGGRYRMAISAMIQVIRRFVPLTALTFIQVSGHFLLTIPIVLILSQAYDVLLGSQELYALVHLKPPAFWGFLSVAVPFLTLAVLLNAWLYFRWFLALPAMMFEGLGPIAALKHSRELTRGRRRRIAPLVVGVALCVAMLPVAFTFIFDAVGEPLLSRLPDHVSVLVPAMVVYLALYIVSTLAITFLGIAANSLLVINLFHRLSGITPDFHAPPASQRSGLLAWGAELLLLLFAVTQAALVLGGFELRDDVTVTAHRGSSMKAPENTLAAIEQAIADGADYIEMDVRLLKDGNIVLSHDRNLRRLTGFDQDLRELTLDEVRETDVGSWFGDAFIGERLATFEEAIELSQGRVDLYVELKPDQGETTRLAEAVIARLRQHDILDSSVIASLDPAVINEVERLAPEVRTTLFLQFLLPGALFTTDADIIGLRHTQATPDTVRDVHRSGRELHVWTVNDTGAMSRYVDMGVDNIITDRPDALADLLDERQSLTDGELLLVKLRNWLRN